MDKERAGPRRLRYLASLVAVFGLVLGGAAWASPASASPSVDQYVAGWGRNTSAQLGNNSQTNSPVPTSADSSGVLAGKTAIEVSAGLDHSCAVTSDGGVFCWGSNEYGQLGNEGITLGSTVPVAVDVTGVLAGKHVDHVSAGAIHTCVVTSDGLAFCWGSNLYGQLGDNSALTRWVPVAVVASGALSGKHLTQVSSGSIHTCAASSDGQVFCWGSNNEGQLGDNSDHGSRVPVQVSTTGVLSGRTVTQVASGGHHTCALTSDARGYCWGENIAGQLGNNSTINSRVPVAVVDSEVLAGKSVAQISTGSQHTCAVTSDGLVFCWGSNYYGQLGNNSSVSSSVPVAVVMNGVLSGRFVSRSASGLYHSCVQSTDRAAFCWGQNKFGQLGDNSMTDSRVPVAVLPVAGSFNAPKPVVALGAGGYVTLAIYGFSVRPGSPSGLAVSGDVGSRILEWQAPVMSGGSAVTQYWVFYRPVGQTSWKAFARGMTATQVPLSANAAASGGCTGAAVCPRLYGSLLSGTSYDFQVLAVNSYGNGRWSNVATYTH